MKRTTLAFIFAAFFLASLAITQSATRGRSSGCVGGSCAIPMASSLSKDTLSSVHGKIQIVNSFPDYKVQVVNSFPDMKVQVVESFPDAPGKWQFVNSFPDHKIQFVESFPDFTIQYVNSFPGVN